MVLGLDIEIFSVQRLHKLSRREEKPEMMHSAGCCLEGDLVFMGFSQHPHLHLADCGVHVGLPSERGVGRFAPWGPNRAGDAEPLEPADTKSEQGGLLLGRICP